MVGNGDVVLSWLLGCETNMTARLAGDFVATFAEGLGELATIKIPWELHEAMTSSRTKWRRINLGRSRSSKWH